MPARIIVKRSQQPDKYTVVYSHPRTTAFYANVYLIKDKLYYTDNQDRFIPNYKVPLIVRLASRAIFFKVSELNNFANLLGGANDEEVIVSFSCIAILDTTKIRLQIDTIYVMKFNDRSTVRVDVFNQYFVEEFKFRGIPKKDVKTT